MKRVLDFFLTRKDENDLFETLACTRLASDRMGIRVASAAADATQWWIPTLPVDPFSLDPKRLPPLIQFQRCSVFPSRLIEGKQELRVGRIAIAVDATDPAVAASVRKVWTTLKKMTTNEVVRINPVGNFSNGRERTIHIGPDAASWSRDGNLLASNAANIFYAPMSDAVWRSPIGQLVRSRPS